MRLRYIIKKVLIAIITLWIIATASFFMLKLLPGTPFSSMQMVGIEMQERLMKYYGLDKPVFEQYLIFLRNTAQGNFGMSYKYLGQSVNDIIKKSFPISLQLGLQAYALSLASGIVLGIISAKKRGSNIDSFFMVVSALFAALPVFVLSSVLQYVFGVKFKLLPLTGWETPTHMILPTISLVFVLFSSKLLTTRTLALEVLNEEYMLEAKNMINDNWGELKKIGTLYAVEVAQNNVNYTVVQVNATYENLSIAYTITFDDELKLAGVYFR